ncbi:MAG: DNA polymerase III subunit alpha [Candidatus Magasanikbacteria bacterium]
MGNQSINSNFTHLHVHSHYSMLDGLSKPKGLVKQAKEYGMEALALTDHGNLYGAVEFYQQAKEENIKPILGMEAYTAPHGRKNKEGGRDKERRHITFLAKNKKGWRNLIKLSTKGHLEGFYYKPRVDEELIKKYNEGIICLSGCRSSKISTHLLEGEKKKAKNTAERYSKLFGDDYYLEMQPHVPEIHEDLSEISKELNIPLVATGDTHYTNLEDKDAHEILLAVQTGNTIYDEDRLSLEEFNLSFRSLEEMKQEFEEYPSAIKNTMEIAQKCEIELETDTYRIPEFETPNGESSKEYLRTLLEERLRERYEEITDEIKERLERELKVINKMDFATYFLIVQDIVNWAKKRGIVVGPGRGSAAGSLVSYVLGITNVDPIKYDLLFERFLNPERIEVPDIDIDFTDTRRDEVMAYVREKYGEDHVAQIITFGKMKARAAIRDAGRALGLPYGLCDRIAKLIPFDATIDEAMEQVDELQEEYEEDEEIENLIDSAKKLEGVARHPSVHACGVVISPEPLTKHVPLQRAPQDENAVITQFEMDSVEELGLLKMDFLGLKNLTTIEETINLVEEHEGDKIDIENLPLDDKKTYELLQEGKTTGVFQLESDGMKRYLKKLRPTELEDVIAMISLYRPGPMDLIPQYIRRKHGEEEVTFIHPDLEPILGQTYGVGIYQEQMMQIARDLAGFSLGEADVLRKAIGKKIESLLQEQKQKLIEGMIDNGISQKKAEEIWELFPPFARYGFNRSHAASYAMISYQTAYLKAHYPIEFMTGLMNTSATDIDRITELVKEANNMGIEVMPPDVNKSMKNFSIDEEENAIRFGLLGIKNLGRNVVKGIIKERTQGGPFKNLTDFLSRIHRRDFNKTSLESLIKSGALTSLGISREKALTNLSKLVNFNQAARKKANSDQGDLFGKSKTGSLNLEEAKDIDKKQMLDWEKELLGLYLTDHPFSEYKDKIHPETEPIEQILIKEEDDHTKGIIAAGIINSVKQITTKRGNPMLFVSLEDDTDEMELLVFSDLLKKTRQIWKEGKAIAVKGRVSFRDEQPKLICNKVEGL